MSNTRHKLSAAVIIERTSGASVSFPDGLKTDDVNEVTAAHGVEVDGVALKDKEVTGRILNTAYKMGGYGILTGRAYKLSAVHLDDPGATIVLELEAPESGPFIPIRAFTQVSTVFAAPSLTAMTWKLGWNDGTPDGIADDDDGLLLTGDSDGLTEGYYQQLAAHKGLALDRTQDLVIPGSENTLLLTVTLTGDTLDNLTGGLLYIYIWFLTLGKDPAEVPV